MLMSILIRKLLVLRLSNLATTKVTASKGNITDTSGNNFYLLTNLKNINYARRYKYKC